MTKYNKDEFTSNDFIGLLLPMLYKNGIEKINEEELSRKLYYYYQNPAFKELFQGFDKNQANDKLDIQEEMYYAKYFNGDILWSPTNAEKLRLDYDYNVDISSYTKKISRNGFLLMQNMINEFAIRYNIESNSKCNMNIYGANPNKDYTLVRGVSYTDELGWELVTDGDVKNYEECSDIRSYYFEDPVSSHLLTSFEKGRVVDLEILNANYVILQGLKNEKIKKIKVYTNLIDEETLCKISKIANDKYSEGNIIMNKKPYVRKIGLK